MRDFSKNSHNKEQVKSASRLAKAGTNEEQIKVRTLEAEKEILEIQSIRLENERDSLRAELARMRTPPLLIGTLIELIDDKRAIIKSSSGPQFVVQIASHIKKEELTPGVRVGLHQQSLAILEVFPKPQEAYIRAMEVIERPTVQYSDIGGLEEQIQEIRETVELPLLHPEMFEKIGIEPPKGILLHGPPGTGKTLLAKAVANATNATFIRVIGSELVRKYIGEGARTVREIFEFARQKAPSIIFIDEIDAVANRRIELGTSGDREVQRTLMQLLSELDGFSARGNVRIIAATNRIDILDPAILRPGRFDRIVEIPLPTLEGRLEILKIHSRRMKLSPEVDLESLATITEGASGADLRAICIEAGMFALRDQRTQIEHRDFLRAIDKVLKRKEEKAAFFT